MRYQILEFDEHDNYNVAAEAQSLEDAKALFEIWAKKFTIGVTKIELYDRGLIKILKMSGVV